MNAHQPQSEGGHLNGNGLSGIEYLLELNRHHSEIFCSPKESGDRKLYRSEHPIEISVLKCMDGRLNLSITTNTALGILTPFRNVGGRFNLGWVGFRDAMVDQYEYAVSKKRVHLVIVTYHYSRGDKHRGCAGFKDDTDAAKAAAFELRDQFVRVFGLGKSAYAIVVGVETDLDALVLHGDDEKMPPVDLSTVTDISPSHLVSILHDLCPAMSGAMCEDILPLLVGNIQHIEEIRALNRPVAEITHGESVLAIGRGYDWLHALNTAIIVGSFDPELRVPIATAGNLLLGNLRGGHIPEGKGVVLMSSAPYRYLAGYDYRAAREKSLWQRNFARTVIEEDVPDLVPYLHEVAAVMDLNTRRIEVIDRRD
jgi:hypothetical protein